MFYFLFIIVYFLLIGISHICSLAFSSLNFVVIYPLVRVCLRSLVSVFAPQYSISPTNYVSSEYFLIYGMDLTTRTLKMYERIDPVDGSTRMSPASDIKVGHLIRLHTNQRVRGARIYHPVLYRSSLAVHRIYSFVKGFTY